MVRQEQTECTAAAKMGKRRGEKRRTENKDDPGM